MFNVVVVVYLDKSLPVCDSKITYERYEDYF